MFVLFQATKFVVPCHSGSKKLTQEATVTFKGKMMGT